MLRPASTVALVRPSDGGLEVFLVRRHDNVAFMAGAHVFPGGRVDAVDHLEEPERWCDGGPEARIRDVAPNDARAFQVAAVRELFEEAGVLLACGRSDTIVPIEGTTSIRFDTYRRQLLHGDTTIVDILARERLRLSLRSLVLFAHWVTPVGEPRRFDTYFFLAVAPESQDAAHCNHETTDGIWIRPADALARCLSGSIALPPPTWTTLRALSQFTAVDDAWAWAERQTIPRVEPCSQEHADGRRLVMLPGDPECPSVEGFAAAEKRFVLQGGRWAPVEAVQ